MGTEEQEEELIEQSEMRPPETGLYCFLDAKRPCGASCMAFVTHPNHKTVAASELSEQQIHCALITGVERTGRNLVMLASSASGILKKQSIKETDDRRAAQFQQGSVSPFGKKDGQ
jgi:hypothetical protein